MLFNSTFYISSIFSDFKYKLWHTRISTNEKSISCYADNPIVSLIWACVLALRIQRKAIWIMTADWIWTEIVERRKNEQKHIFFLSTINCRVFWIGPDMWLAKCSFVIWLLILSSEVQTEMINFSLCVSFPPAHARTHLFAHIAVQLVGSHTFHRNYRITVYSQKFHNESSKFQTRIEIQFHQNISMLCSAHCTHLMRFFLFVVVVSIRNPHHNYTTVLWQWQCITKMKKIPKECDVPILCVYFNCHNKAGICCCCCCWNH